MEIEISIEEGHLMVSLHKSDSEGRLEYICAGYLPLADLKEALAKVGLNQQLKEPT